MQQKFKFETTSLYYLERVRNENLFSRVKFEFKDKKAPGKYAIGQTLSIYGKIHGSSPYFKKICQLVFVNSKDGI